MSVSVSATFPSVLAVLKPWWLKNIAHGTAHSFGLIATIYRNAQQDCALDDSVHKDNGRFFNVKSEWNYSKLKVLSIFFTQQANPMVNPCHWERLWNCKLLHCQWCRIVNKEYKLVVSFLTLGVFFRFMIDFFLHLLLILKNTFFLVDNPKRTRLTSAPLSSQHKMYVFDWNLACYRVDKIDVKTCMSHRFIL